MQQVVQQIEYYLAENGLLVISRIICLGILLSLSLTDLKYRKIPRSMLMLGSVLAGGYCLLFCKDQILVNLGGLLIGVLFVVISKVTREGLGYGDSWLLCALGAYMGTWGLLELLVIAWIGVAVAAMAVLVAGKYRRGISLPMVPFIAAGYVTVWAAEILL